MQWFSKMYAIICFVTISLSFIAYLCYKVNVPGSYMSMYYEGEEIYAEATSLLSLGTRVPLDYYILPYCKPQGGTRPRADNLGELLMGRRIQNSSYRFHMNTNESQYLCTTSPLSHEDVKVLERTIHDFYTVNLILDNLPVMRVSRPNENIFYRFIGFPVGYAQLSGATANIFNHLKFAVLVRETKSRYTTNDGINKEGFGVILEKSHGVYYEIMDFQVIPCSVRRDIEEMSKLSMYDNIKPIVCPSTSAHESQVIKENESITFTYEVEFAVTKMTRLPERELYLRMPGLQLHWFSILNSVITSILLGGFLFVSISRKVPKDLYNHEDLNEGIQASMSKGTLGWMAVMGDTFREPSFPKLLCMMVGNGVQIASMAIVTMILAALGFKSQRSVGMLLTAMICLYLVFGFVAGYVGIWLWICIRGSSDGWRSVSWSIAHFFTSISFSIFIVLNIIHYSNGSTAAVSFSVYLTLLALWFCISVPLIYLGGFIATRSQEQITFQVEFDQNPREIPEGQRWSWLLILASGVLPFGTTFVVLTFVFSFIWLGRYYDNFGFLFTATLFLSIVCAEVSVGATYRCLCTKDWKWWWKAFFASGSTGFYFFLYSVNYLLFHLGGLSSSTAAALYLGYSIILAFAMVLSTGAIGFLAAFCFLRNLAFWEKF